MRLRASLCVTAVVGLGAASGAACSSTDQAPAATPESGTCEVYAPPSTFDPASPTVSFSTGKVNVMNVITQSCAFSSCHGDEGAPTGGLYMGADLSKTYLNLVGVASLLDPTMLRVKAGDPANSFVQHKIDDDACTLASCTDDCAESMPDGQDLLAVNDRLTFRAWIAQGALADFTVVYPPDGGADAEADGGASADAGADADAGASADSSGE